MPRNSRHKSHRAHKGSWDGRERSESDEDGGSRDRKQRVDDSATRVSRDPEPDRQNTSSSLSHLQRGNSDQIAPDGGVSSAEHERKRKDRDGVSAAGDRWVGGAEENGPVDKRPKGEAFGAADTKKDARSNLLSAGSKGRSSGRCDGCANRYEDRGGKEEFTKYSSEKDSSRGESSGQYKDTKESDKERLSESVKNVRDSRHERSVNSSSRGRGAKMGSSKAENALVKDQENTEWHMQDELRNLELEKELENRIRRRDGSGYQIKWQGDDSESDDRRHRESYDRQCRDNDDRRCRENVDRRISSKDDCTKNGSDRDKRHKDERNRDIRYRRDKYQEDLDRDHRHRDDRVRDGHFSRDHGNDRCYGKYMKDSKFCESRHKKSKFQDSDHDGGSYAEDHETKFKEIKGHKRCSDEREDHRDLKLQSTKHPHGDVERITFNTHVDRVRSEYRHHDKIDASFSNNRPQSSTTSSSHVINDQSRGSLKLGESTERESPSQERFHTSAASTGDQASTSGVCERDSESHSWKKIESKDPTNSGEFLKEIAAVPQYDRTLRSDERLSPSKLTEKSPSTSDWRGSNKSGARLSLDTEDTGKISSTPKGGRDGYGIDGLCMDNHPKTGMHYSGHIPVGSSSFSRAGHFSGSSPGHLPPPPFVRPRINSPSVSGSFEFEDDDKYQNGDRKFNSRCRSGQYNTGRAQGRAWRSNSLWPPVPNGFIPFQHCPQPLGFHPAIQRFPAPSLFGIRPCMDVNPTGVSYHLHEAADRFGYERPFEWHNQVDDSCPPQLQGWDGSNSVFSDESQVYGRPEWDKSRHLMGSQGWGMNADKWKGQSINVNMEFSVPQKEPEYTSGGLIDDAWVGQSGHGSQTVQSHAECVQVEGTEIKQSNDTPSAKHAVETTTNNEKTIELPKTPSDDNAYLSMLDNISLCLACSDLYKQCLTLLGTRDPLSECSFSKHGCSQNVKDGTKAAAKSSYYILNSLFPRTTEVVFQKVMSLYKQQNEALRFKIPVSQVLPKEERSPPEASVMEEVKAIICQKKASNLDKVKAVFDRNSDETLQATANPATDIEEDGNTITENDVPGDAEVQKPDLISDAAVFVENSSLDCEVIMQECRVNLNRIHNSPESAH